MVTTADQERKPGRPRKGNEGLWHQIADCLGIPSSAAIGSKKKIEGGFRRARVETE
jgi:hypothetical protein